MWPFKENYEEENKDIRMAAAGFIFLASNKIEAFLGEANVE
jgi:hypothetical protein